MRAALSLGVMRAAVRQVEVRIMAQRSKKSEKESESETDKE